jgi:hypothetical protein
MITPEPIVMDKEDGRLFEIEIGRQQKVSLNAGETGNLEEQKESAQPTDRELEKTESDFEMKWIS